MNLTDLSAELEIHADEVQPAQPMARLIAVRQRVRTRRRRQIGASALIAAVCAVAIAVFPTLTDLPWNESTPPASGHPLKPFPFDDVDAGDPLVAHIVGAKGQNQLEFRFTPTDTNLRINGFCYLPSSSSAEQPRVSVSVNGHAEFTSGECANETSANAFFSSSQMDEEAANRRAWAKLGVVPGRESVFRAELQTKGSLSANPDVRLGMGIYLLSGQRVTSDGVVIKYDAETDGHDYRLAGSRTVKITSKVRRMTFAIPASPAPIFLVAGSPGSSEPGITKIDSRTVHGIEPVSAGSSGGWISQTLKAIDAQEITVTVDAKSGNNGVLLVAYYTQVD